MAKITNIETQKRIKDRVNIYVDYEYCLAMSYELLLKNKLKVGSEVNETDLKTLVIENEKNLALNKCAKLLSKNLKTENQIRNYLLDKGYSNVVIDYCVNKLIEYSYINDLNYAKIYYKSVKNKFGKIKIANQLKLKGVSKEIIENVLGNYESDTNTLLALSKKFLKNKEISNENLIKLSRHLIGKGFSYEEINSVIKILRSNDVSSWC